MKHMKRMLTALLLVALLLGTVLTLPVAAYESDVSAWQNIQLHGLYVQSDMYIYSDLAEEYMEDWWEGEIPELDGEYVNAPTLNARGFSMSANGEYAYIGTLNGGTARGVVVLDMMTGKVTDFYYNYEDPSSGAPDVIPFSFAKGIAADDRGMVYIGFAYSQNYNLVSLDIAEQKSDGTLERRYNGAVWSNDGVPGNTSGTKVGVNGVDVVRIEDKYYCYVMTNYDVDMLYCYDVTDPANPVLNEDFGDGGRIDFSTSKIAGENYAFSEGQYLDVAEDGTVYLVAEFASGASILAIAPDGNSCSSVLDYSGAYCVEIVGDFMLVGLKDGSSVHVLDKQSGEKVAELFVGFEFGDRIVRMQVINGVLYVGNPGSNESSYNAILTAGLTEEGLELLRERVDSLNGGDEATEAPTDAPTDAPVDDPTEAPTQSPDDQPTEAPTNAPADDATDGAPAGTAADTKPASDDGGCTSVLLSGGALTVLLAAAFVTSKRK